MGKTTQGSRENNRSKDNRASNGIEGRQLSVIRKINGRIEPSMRDFQIDNKFQSSIGLEELWKMEGQVNLVEKIANEVSRC